MIEVIENKEIELILKRIAKEAKNNDEIKEKIAYYLKEADNGKEENLPNDTIKIFKQLSDTFSTGKNDSDYKIAAILILEAFNLYKKKSFLNSFFK